MENNICSSCELSWYCQSPCAAKTTMSKYKLKKPKHE